jgi:hypothetical protein
VHLSHCLHDPLRPYRLRLHVRERWRVALPFQLTIVRGKDEGKNLTFEQPETKIGRNPENDVILLDVGVSRDHACIQERSGRYYAQDLGSANGTKINGARIGNETPIEHGDSLGVGPVVIAFSILGRDDADLPTAAPQRLAQETNIMPHTRPGPATLAMRAVPPKANGLSRKTGSLAMKARKGSPTAVLARSNDSSAELRASDRARLKRKAKGSPVALARYTWLSTGPIVRRLLVPVLLASLVGVAWAAKRQLLPDAEKPKRAEPEQLGAEVIRDSFGVGEGVTFVRDHMKAFFFQVSSPTEVLVILHYQARSISDGEVSLGLNGIQLGTVPADTHDAGERQLQQVLIQGLKRNERNEIIFTNVRNPPEQDAWRIWNLWVEVIPVPDVPVPQRVEQARLDIAKARELYARHAVGPENLFNAWKGFRTAWVNLEGIEPRPALYEQVLADLRATALQLDRQCAKLMLEVESLLGRRRMEEAGTALQELLRYFPTTEHRCHNLARDKLREYDL